MAKPARYRAGFKSYGIYLLVTTIRLVSFLFNAPHLFEMELASNNNCVCVVLIEGNTRKVVAPIEFLSKFLISLMITCLSFLSLWFKVRDSPALFLNQQREGRCPPVTHVRTDCYDSGDLLVPKPDLLPTFQVWSHEDGYASASIHGGVLHGEFHLEPIHLLRN